MDVAVIVAPGRDMIAAPVVGQDPHFAVVALPVSIRYENVCDGRY